ncbi:hypothetical protein D3C74_391100 [compost metagenome]
MQHALRFFRIRGTENDLLDFGKLMHTVQSAYITSAGANLTTETRRYRGQLHRLLHIDNLIRIIRDKRHFRSPHQPLVLPFEFVDLIPTRWEESGVHQRILPDHQRNLHWCKAVLQQQIQRQLLYCPM